MVSLELRESKPCMICRNEKYDILYQWPAEFYDHSKFETASWDARQPLDLKVVKCSNCGLVFTNPSFKSENLHLIYPKDLIETELRSKEELLREKKWDGLMDTINKFLPFGASICDVGARYGVLVEKLKNRGYKSFGIELNQGATDYADEIGIHNVFCSDILEISKVIEIMKLERVNAYILDDVLEHLVHPKAELSTLATTQKKGDFLFLRQMNHNSIGRRVFGRNWYYYQPAAHMYFFDDGSIKKMLDQIGYEVVGNIKTPLISQLKPLVVQLLRYVGVKKYLFPPQLNGKLMYLDKRAKLEDMFLIIAAKK